MRHLSLAAALLLVAGAANADVIISNFSASPQNSAGTFIGATSSTVYKAAGWTMLGDAYNLDEVRLTMDFTGGGQAIVSIWTGLPHPSSQVAELQGPPQTGSGDFTFTPVQSVVMQPGETYWIYVVSVPNPAGSFWWTGTSPSTEPTGIVASAGFSFNGGVSFARNRYEVVGSPASQCYADCDADELLNVDDFICFINEFATAQSLPPSQQMTHYANCDGNTTEPILTVDDFICFINEFAAGCP
jgi:hypothetical protein